MNFINSLLLDKLGRVPILTTGLCGCTVMMIFETAMVATYAGTPNRAGNAAGVLFLFLYVTFVRCLFFYHVVRFSSRGIQVYQLDTGSSK